MELLAHRDKPPGWSNPNNPGDFAFPNSDLAFQGDYAFVGSFNGFNVYDISNPSSPTLRTSVVCPGGQGDVSVYGDLLFMSVEETRAKKDCTLVPAATAETRFRGVRIFDISNIAAPVQVGQVQTCRGSHTHTLVTDDEDPDNVYIYVQGTGGVRPAAELAGCVETPGGGAALEVETPQPENSSRWRIEVIKVPVDAPETAAVVNEPRLFSDGERINGLQNTPRTPNHPSGIAWSPRPVTDACHDITVYPALDLAAGACEGNGLLIDISDPANPERISAISDKRFAYWHGATFSNDGKTVVFTDEWGGGTAARCRAADDLKWGANGVYDIVDGKLEWRSYFKIPPVQTTQENCVSHLPSLVPVPGRDIIVQAWYQGGASLVDFSDSGEPAGDRLLRPRPDQPDEPRARRVLVDLLVQRRGLRVGDRPRLRRPRPHGDGPAVGQRDRRRPGGAGRPPERAAPGSAHVGAELQRGAGLHRPGRPRGRPVRQAARPGQQVRRPGRAVQHRAAGERRQGAAARPSRTSSRASSSTTSGAA